LTPNFIGRNFVGLSFRMKLKNLEKQKYKILLVLFSLALISFAILVFNDLKPLPLICDVTEGCFVVQNSPYSTTLGIENEYYGFVFFSLLIFLAISQIRNPKENKKNLIHAGVIITTIWAAYSFYLMGFVIKAYCKYCTVVDIAALISLLIIILFWKK